MRIPRPAAEKLGAVIQDPDLDGLLFGLISRATGGCHEHAARADHPQPQGGRGRKRVKQSRQGPVDFYGACLRKFAFLTPGRMDQLASCENMHWGDYPGADCEKCAPPKSYYPRMHWLQIGFTQETG